MTRFFCGNCRQEIVGSLPCLTCYLAPDGQPVLTMLPDEPKAPTRMEMEEAIVAWGRHVDHALVALRSEVDIDLWGLARRLGAFAHVLDTPLVLAGVDCGAAIPEKAPNVGPTIPETPYGASRGEAWRERDAARAVLRRINDWATMDPAAEMFGWIADETAAALEGKPAPLYAALRRWAEAREAAPELVVDNFVFRDSDEYRDSVDALAALARSALGVGEG